MKIPNRTPLSTSLSFVVVLLVTLLFVGYGITEEIPVGTLDGSVVMQENGKPLSTAFLTITRVDPFDQEQEDVATEHHFKVRSDGHFQIREMVAGEYKIRLSAKAHNIKSEIIDIPEGKRTTITLEAAPVAPYLDMYESQRVYLPSETVHVQLSGFTPASTLQTRLYRLDFDKVIKEGGVYAALAPLARPDSDKVSDPSKLGSLAQSFQVNLEDKDVEGTFRDRLHLDSLAEGLYWVQCTCDGVVKGTWFSVSKIGLITKHSTTDLAAYVTKLDTGEPIKGASVGFATPKGVVASGATSDQGLARMNLPSKGAQDDHEVVVASYGSSKALVDFHRDYSGDSDEDSSSPTGSQTRIYTYTDRPIYRPGDLVQFKGIVRSLIGSSYRLPTAKTVSVVMQDGSGNTISTQSLPLDSMGSYHGQYQFDADAMPDDYSLVTKCAGATNSKDVGVAAYRKPTFSIDVTPGKPTYIRGETAQVEVQTKYYYGAPVVGATITATITRSPYWDWSQYSDSESDYEDEYGQDESPDTPYQAEQLNSNDEGGEETQEISATTDANGKAMISFATIGVNESKESETDFTYTINIDAKDPSDKDFTGSATLNVLRSDEKLKLSTDTYVVPAGQGFTVNAVATNDKQSALKNLPIQVTTGFLEWDRKGDEILSDKATQKFVTGPDGKLALTFNPPGIGTFEVQASFTDEKGNQVVSKQDVYTYNDMSLQEESNLRLPAADLSLILNKKRYKSGDTVKALITCRNPGGTAMIGIEGALIYNVQTLKLAHQTTLYEFKVLNDYSPNAFVSIAYIKDKKYSEASRQMVIDLGIKKLQVRVASDKKVYHPGDTAMYTISTKNSSGQPIPAEVSLGVVDESVYAIFDDGSDIVKGFYPKRSNDIQTDYSFPELYLGGGDKAPTNIQVRRKFKDTAFWQPVLQTGKDGQARVRVKLPDNLTSWRATVRAVTSNTEVGQSTDNVIARKDLMVQLSAPTTVVNGDNERLVAMVTNNTGHDQDVKLNLAAQDSNVEGDLNQSVHIADGAMQTVEYRFTPAHSGTADFVAKAWVPGGASDGMELKVPVMPHARLETDADGGQTNGSKEITFTVKDSIDPYSGGVELDIAPTIATSLLGSIDELIDYPYGCVEQTTSRFLPTVVFAKTFRDLGLPRPKLEAKVPEIVRESYNRLRAMQHSDGGWGWWEYDGSDPYMTAYVLEAIARAKISGFAPPAGIDVDKAESWAKAFLKNPQFPYPIEQPTDRDWNELRTNTLYLAYSMSLNGETADAKAAIDKIVISDCDAVQCAFIALAANVMGSGQTAMRDSALARMLALGDQTKTTMNWEEKDFFGYETSGRCFMALETIQPDNPWIPKVVNYLSQERKGNMWYSTRDTSAILIAMADYLRHTKELLSDADISVSLNGRPLKEFQFQKQSFPDKASVIKLPISALQKGDNKFAIQAKSGVCYYTASLKQYVVSQDMPALTPIAGLSVTRSYYKLGAERMEDGSLRLMPSKSPIEDYQSGDIIQCQIKVHSDFPRQYVFIEDPTPSALHVTDRETPDDGETWSFWWSRTVILDDRVCFFARNVPAGDSVLQYSLQAEIPGACAALPTTIYNMYDPSDMASTGALVLTVSQ